MKDNVPCQVEILNHCQKRMNTELKREKPTQKDAIAVRMCDKVFLTKGPRVAVFEQTQKIAKQA